MSKALMVSVVSFGFTLALSASTVNSAAPEAEPLQLDNLYACGIWPTCRDPDEMKPTPADTSAPKPTGDKDTTKDKKDEARLA